MKTLVVAALLALSGAAQAAETYALDAGHSFAVFEWDHFGLARHSGKFGVAHGTLTLDPPGKPSAVEVTLDTVSVTTGASKLDEHLKSPDFFDAAKYPAITFKSTAMRYDGERLVGVDGNLTVHGVTKPVSLTVQNAVCKEHPMKKVPACGANATGTVKRTDFGVGMYVPAVSDEIRLAISVEAQKK